jgi:hypothetical protein
MGEKPTVTTQQRKVSGRMWSRASYIPVTAGRNC